MRHWSTITYTALALVALAFIACTSEGPEPKGPFSTNRMVLQQRNISIEGTARSQTFPIDANCAWSITTVSGWENLVITPTEGIGPATVTLSTPENDNIGTRTASLRVSTGDISSLISVSQLPGRVQLTVTPEKIDFPATGGDDAFSLTCNTDWTITGAPSWLTVSPSAGEGSLQPQTISLAARGHDDERADSVWLTVTGIGIENATKTVLVTRASGRLYLDPSEVAETLPATSGSVQLSVSANVEWLAQVNDTWVTFADGQQQTTGSGNAVLTLNYEENTGAGRELTITFHSTATGTTLTCTRTLRQAAATQPVITDFALDEASINKNAATASFRLAAGNLPTTSCGLLVSTDESQLQNGTKYAATTTADGLITVTATGLNKGQTYYVCAFATNNAGTVYSSVLSFKTKALPGEEDNPTPE